MARVNDSCGGCCLTALCSYQREVSGQIESEGEAGDETRMGR